MVVELNLFRSGIFMEDEDIASHIKSLFGLYSAAGRQVVQHISWHVTKHKCLQLIMKANGKLAMDLVVLNAKVCGVRPPHKRE